MFKVDQEKYLLVVSKKQKSFVKKLASDLNPKADLIVSISNENMMKLVSTELKISPQQAFMKGMLKVKGNMALAMKLAFVTNATKKMLASEKKSRL